MSTLRTILNLYRRDIERHYGGRTVGKTLNEEEAVSRIKELLLSLVGEDRKDFDGSNTWDNFIYGENKIKAELRQKISDI